MQACHVCNGRTMSTANGVRCMNAQCEGSKEPKAEEGITCKCGDTMVYKGMNSWGEPSYGCPSCGAVVKL